MEVRYNVLKITSLTTFASIKGGVNRTCKDVYFVRCIGHNNCYLEEIETIDKLLSERENCGQGKYIRAIGLPGLNNPDEILYYSEVYDKWKKDGSDFITLKGVTINKEFEKNLIPALEEVIKKFKECTRNVNESIQRNFLIKIIYWLNIAAHSIIADWNERESYKYIFSGKIKKQEYLFLYLLTLLGIDVMILMPEGEVDLDRTLLELSYKLQLGTCSGIELPIYDRTKYLNRSKNAGTSMTPVQSTGTDHSDRTMKKEFRSRIDRDSNEQEKNFEELAMLASSVVMISVHDGKGDIIATGSGIIISADGYILTNNHVASGGSFYSVRIEDDEELYITDEIIKNNSFLDLALIRIINKRLKPIPIYGHTKGLVRGQKVVAIGSPLGMFNSVSDGIISGFRKIDDVEMIQFTAPISHGSSGGALLNLYGEVIGISTAGIDSGQNINLAVDYQNIYNFVRGFI